MTGTYRTEPGAVLRDRLTGERREVIAVLRAEDLHRLIDGSCYRQKHRLEQSALNPIRPRRHRGPQERER